MVPLTSTFNFVFLLAQKMTCPYLAHAKELPFASSSHTPFPQVTWYTPSVPQHPIMGHGHICIYNLYKCVCLTTVNMNLLPTSFVGDVYKYTMIFNKYVYITKEKHIHFISQSHQPIFQENPKSAHSVRGYDILSVHIGLRVKME